MWIWKQFLGETPWEVEGTRPAPGSLEDSIKEINDIKKNILGAVDTLRTNHACLQKHLLALRANMHKAFDTLNRCTAQKTVCMDACTQQALTDIQLHHHSFKITCDNLSLPDRTSQSLNDFFNTMESHVSSLHQAFEQSALLTQEVSKKRFVRR